MKKYAKNLSLVLLVIFALSLVGCGATADNKPAADKPVEKKLLIGVAPGLYGDMIKLAIRPVLEKKGYKIEMKEFSDYVQPNLALNNKELDANLFQHRPYLEKFSADKGLKLSPVVTIPTAGLGIYSRKIKATNEEELKKAIKPGDEVTIANDPTNLSRALGLLAKHGLITIRPNIDPTKASEKDIATSPFGLKVSPIEAAQLPRTLDSVALSVVNGNYAIAAGISLSSAIIPEDLAENLKNLLAVRTEDLEKPFVKDLKDAIESEEFKNVIEDPKYVFKGFQKPAWYKAKWNIK